MHFLGVDGHAAPHLHLRPEQGWSAGSATTGSAGTWSSRIGAFIIGAGVLLFVYQRLASAASARRTPPNDPWDAATLEWAIPSPPPVYNFARIADGALARRLVGQEATPSAGTSTQARTWPRLPIAGHDVGHAEFEEAQPSEEYLAQERNAHAQRSVHDPHAEPVVLAAASRRSA